MPSLVCGRLPTSADPTGTWSSEQFANYTLPARPVYSSAARKASAHSYTYCVTCTARATKASASCGARRTSKASTASLLIFITCVSKATFALRRILEGANHDTKRKDLDLDIVHRKSGTWGSSETLLDAPLCRRFRRKGFNLQSFGHSVSSATITFEPQKMASCFYHHLIYRDIHDTSRARSTRLTRRTKTYRMRTFLKMAKTQQSPWVLLSRPWNL